MGQYDEAEPEGRNSALSRVCVCVSKLVDQKDLFEVLKGVALPCLNGRV